MHGKSRIPLQEGAFRLTGRVFPTRFEALFRHGKTQLERCWRKEKHRRADGVFLTATRPISYRCQRLIQVGNDIVCMLDTDRQTYHVFRHPSLLQLLIGKLPMGG